MSHPKVPAPDWERIGEMITNPDSPVGIDAKKTHIIIIHALERLEARLTAIEERVQRLEARG